MKMYVIMQVTSITFTGEPQHDDTTILDNAFYRTIEDACNKIDALYNCTLDYADESSIDWISTERKEGYGFIEEDDYDEMVHEARQYFVADYCINEFEAE